MCGRTGRRMRTGRSCMSGGHVGGGTGRGALLRKGVEEKGVEKKDLRA